MKVLSLMFWGSATRRAVTNLGILQRRARSSGPGVRTARILFPIDKNHPGRGAAQHRMGGPPCEWYATH